MSMTTEMTGEAANGAARDAGTMQPAPGAPPTSAMTGATMSQAEPTRTGEARVASQTAAHMAVPVMQSAVQPERARAAKARRRARSLFERKEPGIAPLRSGATGEEVQSVQDYLAAFGYLPSPGLKAFGMAARVPEAPRPGEFESTTEKALRAFQTFHQLPVTGTVDDATLGLMTRPRCGFPDAAPFVLQGNRWNGNSVTYAFDELTPDLTMAQVRAAVTQAFGLWSAVTPLTFAEVPLGSNPAADIIIRFVSGDHGDSNSFDGVNGVLAHAFYPPPNSGALAGDTHLDDAETWSVNLPPSGTDLITVLAHEFGHALGLAHSQVNGALMYPYYGGPHRFLHADDIGGIQAIYGSVVAWSGWEDLGGVIYGSPAVASWAADRLDCFVRGTDNHMWHKWWDGAAWSDWEDLGGLVLGAPAAVSWGPDRIDCFGRGTDNHLWHKWWDGSSWSGWEDLGGVIVDAPGAASWAANRLDCFATGTDNHMWHRWWDGSSWSGWEDLGGILASGPGAVSWGPYRIDCFGAGTDNHMHHKWFG